MDLHIPKAKINYDYNSVKVLSAKLCNPSPDDISKVKSEKELKKNSYICCLNVYVYFTFNVSVDSNF